MNQKLKRELIWISLIFSHFVMFMLILNNRLKIEEKITIYAKEQPQPSFVSEEVVASLVSPTPTVLQYGKVGDVENYIREVFGEYADKALLLLSGNDQCSGENKTLDSLAVNINNGRVAPGSRDRGIFQINDYFHPKVTDDMAFDYEQNIDYAFRMFENDNHTFIRWAAGICMGI